MQLSVVAACRGSGFGLSMSLHHKPKKLSKQAAEPVTFKKPRSRALSPKRLAF